MDAVEITPPRSLRRRIIFNSQTPSSRRQLETPKNPGNSPSAFTPSKRSDVSAYSSPDRYSSPPHSPRWILDTPPKISGSLLSSPSKFLDDNMPSRMSRFDSFLNSLSLRHSSKSDKKCSPKVKVLDCERADVSAVQPMILDKNKSDINGSSNSGEVEVPVKQIKSVKYLSSDNKENEVSTSKTRNSDLFIQPTSFYKSTRAEINNKESTITENNIASNKFTFFGGVKRSRSSSIETTKRHCSTSSNKPKAKKAKLSKRMRLGEINVGVRHGIKKPKPKKKSVTIKPFPKIPKIMPSDRIKALSDTPLVKQGSQQLLRGAPSTASQSSQITPTKKIPSPKKIPTPPPDPTKKFFKTNRTLHISKKATVTMENNVKVEVRHGKFLLPKKEIKKQSTVLKGNPSAQKRPNIIFEPMDVDDTPQDMLQDKVSDTVNAILDCLDTDGPKEACGTDIQNITVADDCLDVTENHIASCALKQQPSARQQENLNAGAILSPQVIENLELDTTSSTFACTTPSSITGLQVCGNEGEVGMQANCTSASVATQNVDKEVKLYPIFYQDHTQKYSSMTPALKKDHASRKRKWQMVGNDQYQIDAGQKKFGATQCKECGIVYQLGDWEDEMAHENYHNNASALKFCGWRDERVICVYGTGRVIVVYPDDNKMWLKKVKAVMEVANRETGYLDVSCTHKYLENSKVYMFVNQKSVLGILVAEPKKEAYKMISIEGVDCCSAETYPVWCGVSHIWTAPNHRCKKVATRLVDCMRMSFVFDHFLEKDEFAFSVPTLSGKSFAENYTGTPNFLVYS
ncbi:N-acetyltransferase eco-like [Schistocerca americana]|uniref:N-acetyltransferase eco-like n=1 Tax=Schistocerca americana TaxID=7009 RepID=UPI001F4F8CF9|nr:N-acetyltransferase eco-like [Schistocerca americana]XP_047001646.1 N-acetyltransferase eco-like [Schistocerca americana]